MVLPELRKEIQTKLNVSRQAVSARIATKKKQQAPISDEVATALVAHEVGIDVTKFVERDVVDRIRAIARGADPPTRNVGRPRSIKAGPVSVARNIYIGGKEIKVNDPALTPRLIGEARETAGKIYPLIYLFENSVRVFIIKVLEGVHGKDWWTKAAPPDVQKMVAGRKQKEDNNPWHGKRGAHEIFYCDVDHLRKIVITNWPAFQKLLPDQTWFTVRIGEIESSRNIVSHNNPLSADDVQRVEVFSKDWHRQMNAVWDSIP